MSQVDVTVDCRESQDLAGALGGCPTAALDVGDVQFVCGGRTVVVEIKRVPDLVASVIDGRLKQQRARLLAALKANGGSVDSVVFVVEGDTHHHHTVDVLGVITSLCCRFRIPVLLTRDRPDTVRMLLAVKQRTQKLATLPDPLDGVAAAAAPADAYRREGCLVHTSKKRNLFEGNAAWVSQLQCVPGVSGNIACSVAAEFQSACALAKAMAEDRPATERALADIVVPSLLAKKERRLGPAIAARIVAAAAGEPLPQPSGDTGSRRAPASGGGSRKRSRGGAAVQGGGDPKDPGPHPDDEPGADDQQGGNEAGDNP